MTLLQIGLVESIDPVERNDIHSIVEVGVVGTGNNQQFFVVAFELFVGAFAEVTGVSLFAVYDQNGAADFIGEGKQRHCLLYTSDAADE